MAEIWSPATQDRPSDGRRAGWEDRNKTKKWGGDGHITSPTFFGRGSPLGTKKAATGSYHEKPDEISYNLSFTIIDLQIIPDERPASSYGQKTSRTLQSEPRSGRGNEREEPMPCNRLPCRDESPAGCNQDTCPAPREARPPRTPIRSTLLRRPVSAD